MQKVLIAGIFLFFSCKSMQSPKERLGKVSIAEMKKADQCGWVSQKEGQYMADPSVLNQMARMVDYEPFEWKVYVGCWCDDSEQLLPKFRDVMKGINFPEDKLHYYLLDLNKESPAGTEKADSIAYVPTFILYKNGKEAGRIVEQIDYPMESVVFQLFSP